MWRKYKGLFYERAAEQYLKNQGLKSIECNYSCRFGEIDLIMQDDTDLCFVEVKYRRSNRFGGSAYSIAPSKQQKILRTALSYIGDHPKRANDPLRFDAVLIQSVPDQSRPQINWIRNAFDADNFYG